MGSFVDYLGCGRLSVSKNAAYYTCSKFSDISEKIIAFFSKYEILGVKSEDFKNFCRALEIVKSKNHLTKEGFNNIRKIKANMNVRSVR